MCRFHALSPDRAAATPGPGDADGPAAGCGNGPGGAVVLPRVVPLVTRQGAGCGRRARWSADPAGAAGSPADAGRAS